jgi:NADH-quinone oxidoreductase subunit G
VVISGPSCGNESIIRAAANVAWALCSSGKEAALSFTTPECNTFGVGLLRGRPLEEAFEAARSGEISTLIVLENDLYRRAEASLVNAFFHGVKMLVVIDHVRTPTAESADVVLSCGSAAEGDGNWVSSEGRAQRFFKVLPPSRRGDRVRESWRWLNEILESPWRTMDELRSDVVRTCRRLAGLLSAAPEASFRIAGQKVPRQTPRSTGRTALDAHRDVHEQKPPEDRDSPLSFSMEGYPGQPPSPLVTQFHAPSWNSIQSVNKYQQRIGGPLRGGDPGIRLIEPKEGARPSYFREIPEAFRERPDAWYVVPVFHIFGSEELSASAPAIRERAPDPYVAVRPEVAERLGVLENEEVAVEIGGTTRYLPAKLWTSLPRGLVGLPVGLRRGLPFEPPQWIRLTKVRG